MKITIIHRGLNYPNSWSWIKCWLLRMNGNMRQDHILLQADPPAPPYTHRTSCSLWTHPLIPLWGGQCRECRNFPSTLSEWVTTRGTKIHRRNAGEVAWEATEEFLSRHLRQYFCVTCRGMTGCVIIWLLKHFCLSYWVYLNDEKMIGSGVWHSLT